MMSEDFEADSRERATPENLLLIAAREPTPGQTKTRLGAAIGMEAAATLYRAFLTDLAARFGGDEPERSFAFGWGYSPPTCDFRTVMTGIRTYACPGAVRYVPQDGPDWGIRQANLLRWGRDHGFVRTVLTASDSPQMSRSVIDGAFKALQSHDIALGRVHDGGYYLIGMRGYHDVLSGVPMSTSNAADALVAGAISMGLSVAELPVMFDVDTEEDLVNLTEFLNQNPEAAPATARALVQLGLSRQDVVARMERVS